MGNHVEITRAQRDRLISWLSEGRDQRNVLTPQQRRANRRLRSLRDLLRKRCA
jgi:hypothetical protein